MRDRREEKRKYYEGNKARILDRQKRQRTENRAAVLERNREYYAQNSGKVLDQQRGYRKANRTQVLDRCRKYSERAVKEITSYYARRIITQETGLKKEVISQEFIEAKRILLLVKRKGGIQ